MQRRVEALMRHTRQRRSLDLESNREAARLIFPRQLPGQWLCPIISRPLQRPARRVHSQFRGAGHRLRCQESNAPHLLRVYLC